MTQQDDTFTGGQKDGAVAANHETQQLSPMLVGPVAGAERNTIRLLLPPVACWRVDDFRFDFDSSFIRPQIDRDMALLAKAVRECQRDRGLGHRPRLAHVPAPG